MNRITRLIAVVFLVTLAIASLWGFLAINATAEARNQVFRKKPGFSGPLHFKSRLGLMPPAYGLPPGAFSIRAPSASPFPYLTPYTTVLVGSWPHVLAAADLTGDGRADAAVATDNLFGPPNDERLHLFAAQPSDLVSRTQRLTAGTDPEAIVAADLTTDGQADVALALAGDDVLAFYTQTGGQLSGPVTISLPGGPNALATGDFTGDLHPDLAAVAPLSSSIRLWKGASQGLDLIPFALPYPTGGFDALDVGDLDNDGDDDIVALRGAGYLTNSVVVYLQDSGHFSTSYALTPTIGGYLPHSLAVGDVDGDGEDDVLVTAGGNAPDAYLNVFLQEAGALITTPITYTAHHLPGAVAIGDLNHDGREDVVVAHDAWLTLGVYTQTAGGTLSAYATANLPYSDRYRPDALALADLDGNGGLDVALVDLDHGLVVLTNTLTAPDAVINQPPEAAVLSPGPLAVNGTTSPGTAAVEVRLRGHTGWQAATLNGMNWSTNVTLPAGERAWWVEARAIDGQGHVQSPPARRRIGVEDGLPQGRVIINDTSHTPTRPLNEADTYATNRPTTTLLLPAYDVSGVAEMRLSTTDTFPLANWLTYNFSHTWMLSSPDGTKTVYAQFRDGDGNVSAPVSDTIIFDTISPTSRIIAAGSRGSITITWEGEDERSDVAFYDVQIRGGASDDWRYLLWHTTLTQTFVICQSGHTCSFRVRATDRAGNVEDWPVARPIGGATIVFGRGGGWPAVYLPRIWRDR